MELKTAIEILAKNLAKTDWYKFHRLVKKGVIIIFTLGNNVSRILI